MKVWASGSEIRIRLTSFMIGLVELWVEPIEGGWLGCSRD